MKPRLKNIPLAPLLILIGTLMIVGISHPRFSLAHETLAMFEVPEDMSVDAYSLWQRYDLLPFSYRLPPMNTVPKGPLTQHLPQLEQYRFDQVSVMQAAEVYSLDLVPEHSDSLNLILTSIDPEWSLDQSQKTMPVSDGILFIRVFSPDEAKYANGYYFEDKSLHRKPWIHISYHKGI
jgi:hypothetical protein